MKSWVIVASVMLLMSGCAVSQKPHPLNAPKQDSLQKNLLSTSPVYAQNHLVEAIEENMEEFEGEMPLYRQPLFAKMVVFPYISHDTGTYHGYQEVWLKIKEGEFVLAKERALEQEKIFHHEISR